MAKFEIIVRETRVLKYKVDAPSEQIAVDRIITDSYLNPLPYQTQRIQREVYTVALPEPIQPPTPVSGGTADVIGGEPMGDGGSSVNGLQPHPTEKTVTAPKKIYKRGRKK